jgi:hypothetical protein
MSHLIEEYAKSLGVKIGKPIIADHFFPVAHDKYITIHCDNKIDSKYYEYFPQVLNLIRETLHTQGYAIYQIGGPEDPKLNVDGHFLHLNYKQSSFLIKNSKLHVGIDSLPIHIASVYDIPIVVLYSHVYPAHAKPYWSSEDNVVILDADRGDNKPSYNYKEDPKTIRSIKPETIANSIFKLLKINGEVNFSTKYIGSHYHLDFVEVVPDFKADLADKSKTLYLRADLHFNEDNILFWLSQCRCNIITNKPIDINILKLVQSNINHLYLKTTDLQDKYLENLRRSKINFTICCDDEDSIAEVKNKFFEYRVEFDNWKERAEKVQKNNCNFLTNKVLLSNGQLYPSECHLKIGKQLDNSNQVIHDDINFWKEAEHFLFYERTSTN